MAQVFIYWANKWNLFHQDGRIKSVKSPGCELQIVNQLIQNKYWNKELVERVFNKADVEDILRIPISFIRRQDRLVWIDTKNGLYSVRIGYGIAKRLQSQDTRCLHQEEFKFNQIEGNSLVQPDREK